MPKIVPENHKTWNKWINILDELCTDIWFLYRNLPEKDYWIDWEIEILKNDSNLEHLFKVQVKSTEIIKKSWDRFKMKSISREDLIYWHNDINMPVFMIAVETNTRKVYWIDTREYYEKVKNDKKLKTTLVYVDKNNELSLENKDKFIKFTKELNIFNSKKELIKSSSTEKIKSIAIGKWYQVSEQIVWNQNITTLFSTEHSKLHPINWKVSIKESLWNNKFSLNDFELKIWEELVDNFLGWTIEFIEVLEEEDLYLCAGKYEYKIKINKKVEWNNITLKSLKWELFELWLYIDFKTWKTSVELSCDMFKLDDIEELSNALNFLVEIREWLNISILDKKWMKKTILSWDIHINTNSINDLFISYINLLYKIWKKFNFNIKLKELLDSKLSNDEIYNLIPYLHSIIDWKYLIKKDSILSFDLKRNWKGKIPDTEQDMRFLFWEFQIFWNIIPLDLYVQWKWIIKEENWKYSIKTKELLFYSEPKNEKNSINWDS